MRRNDDYILNADGSYKETSPQNGKYYDLRELQSAVGGLIEPIYIGNGKVMFINGEGKLMGLPVNLNATLRLNRAGITDYVAGSALITTEERYNDIIVYKP